MFQQYSKLSTLIIVLIFDNDLQMNISVLIFTQGIFKKLSDLLKAIYKAIKLKIY